MANRVDFYIKADNTEAAKKELQRRVRVALEALGIQAASAAREEIQKDPSRIDTGLLRNSITHAMDGGETAIKSYSASNPSKYDGTTPDDGSYSGTMPEEGAGRAAVYVGSNVSYGIFVHEGFDLPSGRHVPPNRFIKNAIENNESELSAIERKYIDY